jgi:hypothetical protein
MIPSADEIAEKASRGENISAYFSNKFTVVKPIHRVNVDLTQGMYANSMNALRGSMSAGKRLSRHCSNAH